MTDALDLLPLRDGDGSCGRAGPRPAHASTLSPAPPTAGEPPSLSILTTTTHTLLLREFLGAAERLCLPPEQPVHTLAAHGDRAD
jgi:hypothetical protein